MSLLPYPHYDVRLSKDYIYQMQMERYNIFKSQDVEKGCFDVTFEIEGMKLLVNKYILTSVSRTIDVMLSNRWSKKDEVVKIEKYTYEQFFRFVSFLYLGKCELSESNVMGLIDMADFYNVSFLKDYCDRFLSSSEYKIESKIEEMTEAAVKYSLTFSLDTIKSFVIRHFNVIIKWERFKDFKKFFVEFLASVNRYGIEESDFFTAVYKWAEYQALQQKPPGDDNFDLEKAIKDKLFKIVPYIEFYKMDFDFLMSFVVEKGFHLSPAELYKFFQRQSKGYRDGKLLEQLYLLAEKQGLQKQKMSSDDNFSMVDSIRADLTDFIPRIKFYEFDKTFLDDFVAKGILTEEEVNHVLDTRVEIKNEGRVISGSFKDTLGILKAVKRDEYSYNRIKQSHSKMQKFYGIKFAVPSVPSTLKKMKGVDWYLCLDHGALTFKHQSLIKNPDYLIAEMRSNEEFHINPEQMTFITAAYYIV